MADDARGYLKTLGLEPGASEADVKHAYRELAAVWHPDRYANVPQMRDAAQVRMSEINAAYQYLKTHGTGAGQPASSPLAGASAPTRSAPSSYARPRAAASPASDVPLLRAVHILRVSFAATQPVTGLAVSPDGSLILAATGGYAVWWDAQTGHQVQGIAVDKGSVDCIAVASTGRHVAFANNLAGWMGGPRCELRVCDARTGHERHRIKISSSVTSLDFSPDGKQIAAGDASGTARVWEAETARSVQTLPGNEGSGSIRRAVYVDGAQAAKQILTLKTGKTLNEIALWEVRRARLLREYNLHIRECLRYGQVSDIAPSPNGRLLLVANNDPANRNYALHLWDMQTGNEAGIEAIRAGRGPASSAARSEEGQTTAPVTLRGHADNIACVAWSVDGRSVMSGSEDKTARVWDLLTGKESGRGVGHTRAVRAVACGPDGSFVVSGGDDGTVRVWKPQI